MMMVIYISLKRVEQTLLKVVSVKKTSKRKRMKMIKIGQILSRSLMPSMMIQEPVPQILGEKT
jgi:hypothetical protein